MAIVNERLGYTCRILPRTYDDGPVVLKDVVAPILSGEEAVRRIEERVS